MFKDTIRGLDTIFRKDINPPKIILITGPPGAMKSSFIYAIISKYVENSGRFGLYTTLEESSQSHIDNMNSLGVEMSNNMQVTDLTDLREMDALLNPDEETDYIEFLEKMITTVKESQGDKFNVFALDSLGALYSLMENVTNMRKRMFYFFKTLRESNLISFIVMERSITSEAQLLGNEGFLADGIIMLGLERNRGKLVRYLQVEKMRATAHSMEKHAIEVSGEDGITVLGPIFNV